MLDAKEYVQAILERCIQHPGWRLSV